NGRRNGVRSATHTRQSASDHRQPARSDRRGETESVPADSGRAACAGERQPTMTSPILLPRRRVLASSLALLAAACSQPAPLKSTYVLEPQRPAGGRGSPRPATLKVEPFSVAAAFRSRSLVYRETDLKYEADFYNE